MANNLSAFQAIRMRVHEAMLLIQSAIETADAIGLTDMTRNLKDARNRLDIEFQKVSKDIDALLKPQSD